MPNTSLIICCHANYYMINTSVPSIFEIIIIPCTWHAPWNMGWGLLLEVIAFQTWYLLLSSAPCASRAHYTSQLLVIVTGGHCDPETFSTSSPKINNIRLKVYFVSNQACRETTGGLGQNGRVEAPWTRKSRVHSEKLFLLILWSLSVILKISEVP